MSIYNDIKNYQMSLRKEAFNTDDKEEASKLKMQYTVLNLVLSKLTPGGNSSVNYDDNDAIKILKDFSASNDFIMQQKSSNSIEYIKAYNENVVLNKFIPVQLTEDEIVKIIDDFIIEHELYSKKDMKLIKEYFNNNFSGQFDSKLVGKIASSKL